MKIDKLMLKQEIAHAEETLTGDVKWL
jgi:hypothetical protein